MDAIKTLLVKRLQNELTVQEAQQLREWAERSAGNLALYDRLGDVEEVAVLLAKMEEFDEQKGWNYVRQHAEKVEAGKKATVHRIHFLKTAWFKYAAAIILIVTGIIVYYLIDAPQPKTQVVQNTPPAVPVQDVLPGSERAVLTLSDGSKVELNNAASETIKDGDLAIGNEDGELRYGDDVRALRDSPAAATRPLPPAGDRAVSRSIGFNTMTTPKGGQYKLTLADGTKVWLNAASSITYPTAFSGKTREVSVTGEAYFEVSKNNEKPFIVTVASSYPPLAEVARSAGGESREARTAPYRIEVLGTSFNVNSYPDETGKTSLLEGSIKINNLILKPGEAYREGKVIKTNTASDIAWKNGFFSFTDADIKTVMRQLSRWYDIEVEYRGKISEDEFNGEIGRSLSLSQVLVLLGKARINYTIENKKLVILP